MWGNKPTRTRFYLTSSAGMPASSVKMCISLPLTNTWAALLQLELAAALLGQLDMHQHLALSGTLKFYHRPSSVAVGDGGPKMGLSAQPARSV
jgi:hypothetical protein